MTHLRYEDFQEGSELSSLTKEAITQLQLIKYAGASGDFNQIHTVPDYAKEAGLPGTITHGMLIAGILAQMVSSTFGVKQVKNFGVNFKSISKPSDILTVRGVVKKKYENENGQFIDCKVYVEDQNKDIKVEGKITVKF